MSNKVEITSDSKIWSDFENGVYNLIVGYETLFETHSQRDFTTMEGTLLYIKSTIQRIVIESNSKIDLIWNEVHLNGKPVYEGDESAQVKLALERVRAILLVREILEPKY